MSQFKVGDKVQLKTGGPPMTVEGIESESVKCVWFDSKNVLKRSTFVEETLKEFKSPDLDLFD